MGKKYKIRNITALCAGRVQCYDNDIIELEPITEPAEPKDKTVEIISKDMAKKWAKNALEPALETNESLEEKVEDYLRNKYGKPFGYDKHLLQIAKEHFQEHPEEIDLHQSKQFQAVMNYCALENMVSLDKCISKLEELRNE